MKLIIQEPGIEDEQIMACVHQWLSDTKNPKWLLIFDNCDDQGQFQIESYPLFFHGTIVITTRGPED